MNILERNAKLIVILGSVAASFSPIFVRLIDAGSIAIGFYRLTFVVPFFAASVLLWHREELRALSIRQIAGCVLGGLLLAGHYFTWFSSIENTSVASAVVLLNLNPVIILIITGLILREKINPKAVIGVMIAFVGAAIISGGDYSFAGNAIYGDLQAFISAIFFALYFLAGRKMRREINATVYIFFVFATSWVAFIVAMLVADVPFTGYSARDYLYLFAFAIVCQIGVHVVINWGLGHVSPLYISTVKTSESVIAAVLAAFMFAEIPTPWQWVGGAVTICGLLYYNYHDQDVRNPKVGNRYGAE